jgi:molecular chaperone DnaK (HSP70)
LEGASKCGNIRPTITLNPAPPTDPKELRPLVHADIDRIPDEHLAAVHRLLLESEIQRLVDELGQETEQAWRRGDVTEEKIAAAILEHRQKHPYP